MPANLPPQYHATLAKLKKTKDIQEKISILEELFSIIPKHKGTERVREEIKRKIAKLKRERPKKAKREALYTIQKEGGGQAIIIGHPNSGKSSLLNALTNAKAKVASYPFTTQKPQPAMMVYEDIQIQLVDTPPLDRDSPGWLKNILASGDALLTLLDASKNKIIKEQEEVRNLLDNWKIKKKNLFVANKTDLLPEEKVRKLEELKIFPLSLKEKRGLEELKREIFKILDIVRVYTKEPEEAPDLSHPFVFKKGSTLLDLAQEIHKELSSSLKYARLFQKGEKVIKIVGKDYILKEGDILEIHSN